MLKFSNRTLLYFAWIVSICAMLGSLYFSEVMHLVPCVLCWYQRILMYPLVLFIGIGLLRNSKEIPYYVLPMSIAGIGFALFHWLLQMGIIPDKVAPCQAGISCTTKYIEWFGFLTIPFMSLVAFILITIFMAMILKNKKES